MLLTRIVNTSLKDMWFSGRNTRIRTISAAPNTCHHTDTLFRMAMRWPLKMFSTEIRIRMTMNMTNTRWSE